MTSYTVKVLQFNIFLPVHDYLRSHGQGARVNVMSEVLEKILEDHDVNVLVLNELIPSDFYRIIVPRLQDAGFVHVSRRLRDISTVDGGVFVFTKTDSPIRHCETMLFGEVCSGSDCIAAKGVVYTKIHLQERHIIHVFATHLQAWNEHRVREEQLTLIQKFMTERRISRQEPVLLCGDLNIDLYVARSHLDHLLHSLHLVLPPLDPSGNAFTVSVNNSLVGLDDPARYQTADYPNGCLDVHLETYSCPCCVNELIDYTLYSSRHKRPIHATMKVLERDARLAAPLTFPVYGRTFYTDYVSDHFPVLGTFTFIDDESEAHRNDSRQKDESVGEASELTCRTNATQNMIYISVVVILVIIGVFLLLWIIRFVYVRYYRRHALTKTLRKSTTPRQQSLEKSTPQTV